MALCRHARVTCYLCASGRYTLVPSAVHKRAVLPMRVGAPPAKTQAKTSLKASLELGWV